MDPAAQAAQPSNPFAAYGGQMINGAVQTPSAPSDPFAKYGGKAVTGPTSPASSAPPSSNPAQSATAPQGLEAGPGNKEGIYMMKDPSGQIRSIPYSNVGKALDQGHLFADKATLQQYARDHAADPLDEQRVDKFIDEHPYLSRPLQGVLGMGRALAQSVSAGDRTPTTRAETELQLAAATPARTAAEGGGEAIEGLGEYFSGDELLSMAGKGLEGLPLAQKLKQLSGVAQMIDKAPPIIQKLIKIGMSAVKQGTIAGTQTALKTNMSPGASIVAGAGTGLASAVTEGLGAGISNAIANRAATAETVGGVETTVPAELRNFKETPQQTAGKQAIKNAAQGTARQNLQELHEGSTPPATAPGLPSGTGPFEFNLKVPSREATTGDIATRAAEVPKTESTAGTKTGKAQASELGSTATTIPNRVQERGTPGFKTSSAAGETPSETEYVHRGNLTTQDPNVARAHIDNLNRAIDDPSFRSWPKDQQKAMLEARADAQRQMAQYHDRVFQNLPPEQRGVEPIDVAKTVSKVGSYSDAADQVERGGTRIYQLLNDVTGDKFNALREQNKNAWDAYAGASGPEAQAAAERGLQESNRQLDQMFSDLRGVVDRRTLDAADDAFRNAQTIRRVATAVDGSFSGNASSSARSWEQRGFDGNRLMQNLSKLQASMGRGRLERVIGRENLDTLFQVAELNRTNAQRARFGAAIRPVADALMHMHVGPIAAGGYIGHLFGIPWEAGAAAGWGASEVSKRVMDTVLSNPQIAKNLIFAIDSGASPEKYGPFIANLISQSISSQSQGGQQ
jgi:hypothetical protein